MKRTIQIEIDADAGGDRCQSCHLRVPNLAGKHFCVAFDGVELVQIGFGRFERLDACRAAEIAPTSEADARADERRKVLEDIRLECLRMESEHAKQSEIEVGWPNVRDAYLNSKFGIKLVRMRVDEQLAALAKRGVGGK